MQNTVNRPTFVTLFYRGLREVLLSKGVGQIPYYLEQRYGYDTQIVGVIRDKGEFEGENDRRFKLRFLPGRKLLFKLFDPYVVGYLIKNSKEIDILNLYHFKAEAVFYVLLYKLMNRQGVVYLKLDADLDLVKRDKTFLQKSKNLLRKTFIALALPRFFRSIDMISVEQKEGLRLAQEYHPKYAEKFFYLPVSCSEEFLQLSQSRRGYDQKENIILTVGRIGTKTKNNEMLLEAVRRVSLNGWKVVLIGGIEKSFEGYIEQFFLQNPELENAVTFTGKITDRSELASWFDRAKLFCYTSSGESFGTVLTEAMLFHNYIVTTDISSCMDVTDEGRIGKIVGRHDVDTLTGVLQGLIDDESEIKRDYETIRSYALEHFTWERNITLLNDRLQQALEHSKAHDQNS